MDHSVVGGGGTLFVVSTPIGNLGDLSGRAVETLRGADAILAEDTRHTRALLSHFDIHTPLESYHEHNEAATTPSLVGRLQLGARLALVSDAGTPLLSDPGARLVQAAVAAGIAVVPVPGASALLAALVGAALPSDRFTFFGFLPRKGSERRAVLGEIAALRHTAVLYEAANRVAQTLADLAEAGAADRRAVVARELTKQFEEFVRGPVRELAARY
ncbi:MAG: 16S rRNA (cytidine(1402)-2'-O)-methyltransferase, partial [Gemmatimonadaceae bacterium]|nr:16S rRNA (cytidine(1402)-2'-O)-methyltransferase [Gemmatimonadaceae bacterium]